MKEQLRLTQVQNMKRVRVVRIEGGWGARQRLNRVGIHEGDEIFIKRSGIMGGPLLVRIHGSDIALGRGIAHKVVVEEKEE